MVVAFFVYAILLLIIIYVTIICFKINKRREAQRHAAILQMATRRKLSIRTDMQTSPIKRPIISPCKLTKSATFTKISTENE